LIEHAYMRMMILYPLWEIFNGSQSVNIKVTNKLDLFYVSCHCLGDGKFNEAIPLLYIY